MFPFLRQTLSNIRAFYAYLIISITYRTKSDFLIKNHDFRFYELFRIVHYICSNLTSSTSRFDKFHVALYMLLYAALILHFPIF